MTVQHIAVIMDGNGRWAEQRGLARTKGHQEGLEAAKRIVKAVSDLQIPYITLYVFRRKIGNARRRRSVF